MVCSAEENVSLFPLCSITFSQCPSYQEEDCGLSKVPITQDYYDYDLYVRIPQIHTEI